MALALRRNKGRALMADFRRDTAASLGRPEESLQLASLEDTDEVWSLFGPARERAQEMCGNPGYHCLTTDDRQVLDSYVGRLAPEFPQLGMLLFREAAQYCGAVHGDSRELFHRLSHLIELDGEDLLACTPDASAGIFAAWWEEPGGRQVYTLQAWHGAPKPDEGQPPA